MDETAQSQHPAPRLSKTPSWITLGFLMGAFFVWALPKAENTMAVAVAPPRAVQLQRPKLTEIEAVFTEWSRYAAWENDVTEVALWDVDRKNYAICYEVLRDGDKFFFRSIPGLSRPLLTHGVPGSLPLQFTEPEAMRREWLEHVRLEPVAPSNPPPGKP